MKIVIVQLVLSYLALASGYNLDAHNAAVFQEPHPSNERKSYFGYSVALSSSEDGSLVVIGAPRANSSRADKREIIEPGAVYLCTTASENDCSEWSVDEVDYRYRYLNPYDDANKNHAWLGATIQVAQNDESVLMVCSPRWSYGMVYFGICYSKTLKTKTVFYTHEDTQRYIELENAMAGHSLYMKPDGELPFIKGYSVAAGHFYGSDDMVYYAYGIPRNAAMKGEVTIFYLIGLSSHVVVETKVGSQVGEYFGFTLAACDVNNDGTDDLFVGAPLWSEDGDEGRIAVYLSKNQVGISSEQSIRGTVPRARFGSAVVCLGDLDLDGYADVAVGAPYEDGHGAVYIFNGGPDGLTSYSQRIRGSELQGGVRGFGVSISRPRDVDGNGYVDVAVGAYLSDRAVLFRSRPVVVVHLTKLALPAHFSVTENSTQLRLDICALYGGSFASSTLEVNFTLVFDNRVYINEKSVNTFQTEISLTIIEERCISVNATLVPSNMLKPIEVDASISINEDPSCLNCPAVNRKRSKLDDHLEVAFTLDCGSDDICHSDLVVEITSDLGPDNSYAIKSESNVNVKILVWNNKKEPAYDSYLYIEVPRPILVSRMPPECCEQSKSNGTLSIQCKIGNPLRNEAVIPIALDMSEIQYGDKKKTIVVKAETRSKESYLTDNVDLLEILYYVNASIAISGKASENLYSYSEVDVEDTSTESIAFEHFYEVQKFGVSPIEEVTFLLRVPTLWKGVKIAAIKEVKSQVDDLQYKNATESTIPPSNSSFRFKDEDTTLLSRENRTYYVNCSNEEIECRSYLWTLGPFKKPQSSAKVTVKFQLQLSNNMAPAIRGKDVVFVSEATVEISEPNSTLEAPEKRPNYKQISTFFLHRPKPEPVAVWVIVLSILLGLALLSLATGILIKLGFFKRKRIGDKRYLFNEEIVVTNDIE